MTEYLSRSQWTSTSASGATLSDSSLRGVAVHWPGTSQGTIGAASRSSIATRLRSYRTFHVNTRGWRDIGYNLAIDQAGRIWMLRSTQWHGNLIGAHAASGSNPRANHHYVGVLLLLGASETPSAAMKAAFRDWYHGRFLKAWPGRTDVRGHGQVPGAQTSCPGSRARAAISTMTAKPSTSGGSMSWNEDLTPGTPGNDITNLAHTTLPDNWGRDAADLLGYAGSLHAYLRRSEFSKPSYPDESKWTFPQFWRWTYTHARRGRDAAEDARDQAAKNGEKLDAILGAQGGLDTAAVLARIDERHAEAAQQRQTIADTMTDRLDSIAAVLSEHADGTLDAEQVVQRIGELLTH